MGAPVLMEPIVTESVHPGPPAPRLVSVVVPVVERADDLQALHRAFADELESRGVAYEFLFVVDGGFTPPPELAALAERDNVRVLRFARTFGETAALRLGIERSGGDVILTLPAYFQVKPEGIRPLLAALENGSDMAVASRSPRLDSWLNRVQSAVFHQMISGVTDRRFHDIACGVRVMRRSVAEALPLYGDLHRFISTRRTPAPGCTARACTCAACSTSPRSSSWPSSPRSRSASSASSARCSSWPVRSPVWCC
jgi:glycosyltransferase involved in cell wall biosynthesis